VFTTKIRRSHNNTSKLYQPYSIRQQFAMKSFHTTKSQGQISAAQNIRSLPQEQTETKSGRGLYFSVIIYTYSHKPPTATQLFGYSCLLLRSSYYNFCFGSVLFGLGFWFFLVFGFLVIQVPAQRQQEVLPSKSKVGWWYYKSCFSFAFSNKHPRLTHHTTKQPNIILHKTVLLERDIPSHTSTGLYHRTK